MGARTLSHHRGFDALMFHDLSMTATLVIAPAQE